MNKYVIDFYTLKNLMSAEISKNYAKKNKKCSFAKLLKNVFDQRLKNEEKHKYAHNSSHDFPTEEGKP